MKKSLITVLLVATLMVTISAGALANYSITANVEKFVLDNGITVLIKANPAFDIISVVALAAIGSTQDPLGLEGLTYLTNRTMMRGTENRTAQQINLEIESLGASVSTGLSFDFSGVIAQTTTATFESGMDIFCDILKYPSFDSAELEREKTLAISQLRTLHDDPSNEAIWTFFHHYYGGKSYGIPPVGTEKGVQAISPEHLVEWHRHVYRPENMVISISGNIDPEYARAFFEGELGSWSPAWSGGLGEQATMEIPVLQEDKLIQITKPTQAAWMVLGFPAPPNMDEDRAAMTVINALLGDGLGSRLFVEVRDKRGLAYAIMSQYAPNFGESTIWALLATHPDAVEEARQQVVAQFHRLTEEPLSPEELQAAKTLVQGRYLMSNETNVNQALELGLNELVGAGYQWVDLYPEIISEVTVDDVQRVAKAFFAHYLEVLIAP